MKLTYVRAATMGGLFLALSAVSAGAQEPAAAPGAPSREARAAEFHKRMEDMRQRRVQRLHDLLQIRADQETAFKTYMAAIARPKERGPGGPEREPESMTTPERLDLMTARLDRMRQKISATRTFYAALSADQRKAFDAIPMGAEGWRGGFGRARFEGRFGPPPGHHGFDGPPPER